MSHVTSASVVVESLNSTFTVLGNTIFSIDVPFSISISFNLEILTIEESAASFESPTITLAVTFRFSIPGISNVPISV
ncbi:hypothetical protein [Clostridium butyricum]|uniref:hypothetical protein n=1 Tax=Clostridium butyricum TaxID=1492 RepID=UPI00374F7C2F